MKFSKGQPVILVPWRWDIPIRRGRIVDPKARNMIVAADGLEETTARTYVVPDTADGLTYANAVQDYLILLHDEEEAIRKASRPVRERFSDPIRLAVDLLGEAQKAVR